MECEKRLKVTKLACEGSLLFFTRYFFEKRTGSKFRLNWHHEAIIEHLQGVYDGDIQNLIINVPPGSSKTELVSINFPAWSLARNDMCRFLHLSYADRLVALNSQTCRDLVGSEEFQQIWHRPIADDTKSKQQWNIVDEEGKKRGGMYAVQTGGQVTGFRAGYMSEGFSGAIILDDPLKPDDAESDTLRSDVNNQLARTVRSRRARPDTPMIIVMQRLHEEDPTGFLMDGGLGEEFVQLKVPAIIGAGEQQKSYWDFKEPLEQLHQFQAAQPYVFAGQYMQEPAPEQGEYFKREWVQYYDRLPDNCHFYGASDYAVKEGGGDYTVHGVIGVDSEENIYLVDWWRQQASADVWVEAFLDLMEANKTLAWAEEAGQILKSLDPFIRKRMKERGVNGYRIQYASKADKSVRARSIQGRMAMGKVFLPKGKPWVEGLVKELLTFPNGKHDDQVDVLSLIGRMLAGLKAGAVPSKGDGNKSGWSFEEIRQMNIRKSRG